MFRISKSAVIRQPAVAGAFYPGSSDQLSSEVDRLLASVEGPRIDGEIFSLVVPHAGYCYSGEVAATAYSTLRGRPIKRVAVVSPCHVDSFQGSAVYSGDAYQTPLGSIEVDREACRELSTFGSSIAYSDRGHRWSGRGEHSLEVQLPFLQRVLGEFKLIPIVMGDQSWTSCRVLAAALARVLKAGTDCLVASSDLSHFHPYEEAVALDSRVTQAVARRDYLSLSHNLNVRHWEACGGGPIIVALLVAEEQGANGSEVVRYANSGDVSPFDRDRVVGYMGAVVYRSDTVETTDKADQLTSEDRGILLSAARAAIESAVQNRSFDQTSADFEGLLNEDRAVFVTLKNAGRLRGCVGSIVAGEPLFDAVVTAAVNAAQNDFRFASVSDQELRDLTISISVLSPFRRLFDPAEIVIGSHGLMIERNLQRGLLLPQVAAENHWSVEEFLNHTCTKAGLSQGSWKGADTDIYSFSAEVFGS